MFLAVGIDAGGGEVGDDCGKGGLLSAWTTELKGKDETRKTKKTRETREDKKAAIGDVLLGHALSRY